MTDAQEHVSDPVPFLDLGHIHAPLREEFMTRIAAVIDSSGFAGGSAVEAFEREWAEFCGVAHAVAVSNGTDALEVALRALALPQGSGVVVPANSFVATAEAVVRAGLRPVFCDVRADTLLVDAECMAGAIDDSVSCLVPVHLYGQMVEMQPIANLARSHSLAVLEDAAQAHGARRAGVRPGEVGFAAGFSFYPGKNLGALGEAGAVVTSDAELAARMRAIRQHGGAERYRHDEFGFNARMDGFQGAVLSVKLPHLARWNDERRRAAARYLELLKDVPEVEAPTVAPDSEPVWHLFVIRLDGRDEIAQALSRGDVGVGIHYPTPIHLTGAFSRLGYGAGDFPVAEAAASLLLSLPIFPGITDSQIDRVVTLLANAIG